MQATSFAPLISEIEEIKATQHFGRVTGTRSGLIEVSGLSSHARVGDLVSLNIKGKNKLGEVLSLSEGVVTVLPSEGLKGVAIGDYVLYLGEGGIRPDTSWVGRILDAYGRPLDGVPLARGVEVRALMSPPPTATLRKRLGAPVETGMTAFNTFLPIVRGQRIGLFAGSGVGKSTLLAQFAKTIEADFIVIALIGERGRELREFVEDTLGTEGLARSVVIAATSDRSPIERRRAAWTAMTVAEFLRDSSAHVLFLSDSVTRFCDAHREIAVSSGETAALGGYPPSTAQTVMELCERAGPGSEDQGDITAVFSVLVAGSDMEEPIADLVRGVLDGHVVLDRSIAERGRFPAIDALRSVSRSFTKALDAAQQETIQRAKELMALYDETEMMIQAGLYKAGSDPRVDRAIELRPKLESFLGSRPSKDLNTIEHNFRQLAEILDSPKAGARH
ncbi:MAG: FliI/YscN family ATPase [Litoreibacter sp.]|nr:FliI/YscN family ATPase [Litoreibacter sp.]